MHVDIALREDYIQTFRTSFKKYKILFLYPFVGESKFNSIGFYMLSFINFASSVHVIYSFFHCVETSILERVTHTVEALAFMVVGLKVLKIHKHRKFYNKLFNHLMSDIWDSFPEKLPENINVLVKYKNIMKKRNKIFWAILIITITCVQAGPYLVIKYEDVINGRQTTLYYPAGNRIYPFDKDKWYFFVYLYESFQIILAGCMFNISFLNLSLCMNYMCMELSLLGNWLKEVISEEDVNNENKSNVKATHDETKYKLKFIINRYNILDGFVTKYDATMGTVFFVVLISAAILNGLSAFCITEIHSVFVILRYIIYFIASMLEFYTHCQMGEHISTCSTALADHIYSSRWIHADPQIQKILLLFMVRTQRPLQLTAKKWTVLNLNTFAKACNYSYSIFTLLRRMQSKNS